MSRQVNPHVLIWAVALGLGAPGAALAQPTPETTPAARSVALKADALAFAVNGYSGVFRLSLAKGCWPRGCRLPVRAQQGSS